MILLDTGAIFALANRKDRDHEAVRACYQRLARERFVLHPLILAEAWYLCEERLGTPAARKVADSVAAGEMTLIPVDADDIAAALKIESRFAKLRLGLTDAVSLALCERHRIRTVFTLDRRDFAAYSPARGASLTLVP